MLDAYRIAVNRDKSLGEQYVKSLGLSHAQVAHYNKLRECVARWHQKNPGAKIPRRAERPWLEFSDGDKRAAMDVLPADQRANARIHHIFPVSSVPRDAQCEEMASDPLNAIALTAAQNAQIEAVGSDYYYLNVLHAPQHVGARYGRLAVTPRGGVPIRVRAPAGAGSSRPPPPTVAATASQAAPPGNPVPSPGEASLDVAALNEPRTTAPPALPPAGPAGPAGPAPANLASRPTARVAHAELPVRRLISKMQDIGLAAVEEWVSSAPPDDSICQALDAACDSNRMDIFRLLAGQLFERSAGAFDKWIELAVRGNHVDRIEALFRFQNNGELPEPAARALALGLPLAAQLVPQEALSCLLGKEEQHSAPRVVGEALCAAAKAGNLRNAGRLLKERPGVARSHGHLAAEAAMSGGREAMARHLQGAGIELPEHVGQWLGAIDAKNASEAQSATRRSRQIEECKTPPAAPGPTRLSAAAAARPSRKTAKPRPAPSLARWVGPAVAFALTAVLAPLAWRGLSGRGAKELVGAGGDAPRDTSDARPVDATPPKGAVDRRVAELAATLKAINVPPEKLPEVLRSGVATEPLEELRATLRQVALRGSEAWGGWAEGPEMVRALLSDSRLDVNERMTATGATALHVAVSHGHLDVVSLLLERPNIDVDARWWHREGGHDGLTALHDAVASGRVDMIRLLQQDRRVSVTQLTSAGDSPLMMGARLGNPKVVTELLQHPDSDPFAKSRDGETARQIARRLNRRGIADLLDAAEKTRLKLKPADASGQRAAGLAPRGGGDASSNSGDGARPAPAGPSNAKTGAQANTRQLDV